MSSLPDCRQCKHSQPSFLQWLCTRFPIPMPTSWRRHERNECGTNAKHFEPRGAVKK